MKCDSDQFSLQRITSNSDPLLWQFMDLVIEDFPMNELLRPSEFHRAVTGANSDLVNDALPHLLVLVDKKEPVGSPIAGLCMCEWNPEVSCLTIWYLSIRYELRSRGLGQLLYQKVIEHAASSFGTMVAVLLEVELPELCETPIQRKNAEKRIEFYRRLGYRFAVNILYVQHVGWVPSYTRGPSSEPGLTMHLGIHSISPLSDKEATLILLKRFGNHILQPDGVVEIEFR